MLNPTCRAGWDARTPEEKQDLVDDARNILRFAEEDCLPLPGNGKHYLFTLTFKVVQYGTGDAEVKPLPLEFREELDRSIAYWEDGRNLWEVEAIDKALQTLVEGAVRELIQREESERWQGEPPVQVGGSRVSRGLIEARKRESEWSNLVVGLRANHDLD
jgi:hypothetical protein